MDPRDMMLKFDVQGMMQNLANMAKEMMEEKMGGGGNDNEEWEKQVQEMIDQNKVMVFSKSYCPYCV